MEYEYLEFYDNGLVVSPFMKKGVDLDPEPYYQAGYCYISHDDISSIQISNTDPLNNEGLQFAVIEITTNDGQEYRLNYEEAPYFQFSGDNFSEFIKQSNKALEEFRHIQEKIV